MQLRSLEAERSVVEVHETSFVKIYFISEEISDEEREGDNGDEGKDEDSSSSSSSEEEEGDKKEVQLVYKLTREEEREEWDRRMVSYCTFGCFVLC